MLQMDIFDYSGVCELVPVSYYRMGARDTNVQNVYSISLRSW
jgi:hypothetical protein